MEPIGGVTKVERSEGIPKHVVGVRIVKRIGNLTGGVIEDKIMKSCVTGSDGRCTRCRRRIQRGVAVVTFALVTFVPCGARTQPVGPDAVYMKHPRVKAPKMIWKTRKQPRVRKFR